MVNDLKHDQWVEFSAEDGRTQRGRLIHRSLVLGELTFVDWRHKVVAQKTVQGLAADFRRNTARVITDAPVLERALGAMVRRLRRDDEAPASDTA